MTTSSERVMDDYLGRLEHSLSDVPAAQRKVIIAEIVTHIDEALAEEPDDSEASVRNVLDRVGDPEEIASEAREDLDIRRPKTSVLDPLALVLLLIGGFLYLVGWIAGVVFLWLSDVWSTRQKIIGTLFVPGGLVAPLLLFLGSATYLLLDFGVGGEATTVCEGGASLLSQFLLVGLLIFLVVAPIATSIYLGRVLVRARRV